MSKFNTRATETGRIPNTVNVAGGAAYEIKDARKELASVVLASMLNGDKYYQSDASRINQVFDLAAKNPEFAAKAMVYARQVGNLRSVSHVLANAVIENAHGNPIVRRAIRKAVVRPDDMTEMAALWFTRHTGKMLPNAMRRAFKDRLEDGKWDAFQLKRYSKENSSVKLRDIILLTHPRDSKGLFKGVIEGNLKAPKTLESKLAGGEKASDAFEDMLRENRLGYMAAVKNIRNALQTGISNEALDLWCDIVSNRQRVLKSRMLPFRIFDAWMAVKDLPIDEFKLRKVKKAFNHALMHSAENLDMYSHGDKVALILDESGSMNGDPWKHAIILAAVMYHALGSDNVVVYKFSYGCTKLDFGNMSPIDIIQTTTHGGGATYFEAPMNELIRTRTNVDKLIILTDMQLYSPYSWGDIDNFPKNLNEYKRIVNPRVMTLFWDLQGYGEATPAELKNDILLASGFSDKLLSVIPKIWVDQDALVKEIEAVEL